MNWTRSGLAVVPPTGSAPVAIGDAADAGVVLVPEGERTDTGFHRAARGSTRSALRDRLLAGALLIATWSGLTAIVGSYWVPSPWHTISRLAVDTISGDLPGHAMYTLAESVIGLLLGALPGAALPLLSRRHASASAILEPFMIIGYGVPKLALAPLFLLWFGIGMTSKIAVVAVSSFFIVYFQVQAGVAVVTGRLVDVTRVFGATEYGVLRHVVMPTILPYFFAGMKIALPYSIGGAVVAELVSSNRGLGYLVQFGAVSFDTTGVFAALTMVGVLAVAGHIVLSAAELHVAAHRRKPS